MDDLLQEFLTESLENIGVLDNQLLRLEQDPTNKELLGHIFRIVHTVKGTCGFIGLPKLEKVAHAGENVLGKIRDGVLIATPDAVSVILECIDAIKAILLHLETTQEEPAEDYLALIDRLGQIAQGAILAATSPASAEKVAKKTTKKPAAAISKATKKVTTPEPALQPKAQQEKETEPKTEAQNQDSALAASSIRINVDMLENLMTVVSELVLTRNQLLQMLHQRQDHEFTVPLQRLNHITSELQEAVMKTRMQPIGNAWSKLPRLVRDLSKDLNKNIELEMIGAETELDRQVLELIKDPLTHMVRNSGDHGIESPAERLAAGKNQTGTIRLSAYHEGGHIVIELSDDGRGLNMEKIKAKAISAGITTEAEIETMSENQIFHFIFSPGFSTAAQVTNVSGRGVGMDVVRTNIQKIGGTIDLRSKEGAGATCIIKIPLTLAIVSALIVEVKKQRFAIPQIGVVELVRTSQHSQHKIEYINEAPFLRIRDHLLPLISLSRVLKMDDKTHRASLEGGAFIVIAQAGSYTFGLIVDRIFDTQEIVVKPTSPLLKDIRVFSGNTILGDGEVIMILDFNGIAAHISEHQSHDSDDRANTKKTAASLVEMIPLLLFKAGEGAAKAIPLALIARLENISQNAIEYSNDKPVIQYRGHLMPILPINPAHSFAPDSKHAILVFSDNERTMGLVVEEIIDIVSDEMVIKLKAPYPGSFGSAVIGDKMTDIVDVDYYIKQVFPDWFDAKKVLKGEDDKQHILFVEDSQFFTNLIVPMLKGCGFKITHAECGQKAAEICAQRNDFDLIITDIEMPNMDGFSFVETLSANPTWHTVPIIGLSAHTDPKAIERARDLGFYDYISKLDRDNLLHTIHNALQTVRSMAA